MIEGLQPYAEYKESGQNWLGSLPAHWDVRRTKLLLREVDSRSTTGKEQLLRVSQYTGVTPRKAADGSDAPDTRAASLIGYKRVAVNDLVINIMLAWNGSMGVSLFDGIASPAYCVYRLNKGAQPWYYHQLLRLTLYKGRIKAVSTGVIESRLRLYSDDLGRIEVIVPPPDEQAAIVRFLDHANRKIDGFIRAKRKLIALLGEQKQSIIHRAVTCGLDPNAPLKPSGIPWLGDIPGGWTTKPIKRLARVLNGFAFPSGAYVDSGIPLIRIGDVKSGGDVDVINAAKLPEKYLPSHEFVALRAGDLVMAMTGATIGKVACFNSTTPALLNQRVCAFRCRPGMAAQGYLFLLLTSQLYLRQVLAACYGGAQPNISDKTLVGFKMPVAPFEIQDEIVSLVTTETKDINTAIARTEREIALMQEYRTRLTADVVTGKLDVRPAAAKLLTLSEPAAPESLPDEIEDVEELSSED